VRIPILAWFVPRHTIEVFDNSARFPPSEVGLRSAEVTARFGEAHAATSLGHRRPLFSPQFLSLASKAQAANHTAILTLAIPGNARYAAQGTVIETFPH